MEKAFEMPLIVCVYGQTVVFLPVLLAAPWTELSSLMVLRAPSLTFRCPGDSADDSGVVPQEESRPPWDMEEAEGELVEPLWPNDGVLADAR